MNSKHGTPHRRSLRLEAYDYRWPGAYFVTTTTWNRRPLFGGLVNGDLHLTEPGRIARDLLSFIPESFPWVRLDEWSVMPDHVHLILLVAQRERQQMAIPEPARNHGPTAGSLGAIIGSYKSIVSRKINALRTTPGARVWAGGYHERVIRDESGLFRARQYVRENVWKHFVGRRPIRGSVFGPK